MSEGKNQLLESLAKRSFAQWMIAYAVVIWFFLEFLDFLTATYGWDDRIVKTATTLLVTGFLLMATVAWFHGEKGRQQFTVLEVCLLIFTMMLMLVSSGRAWSEEVDTLTLLGLSALGCSIVLGCTFVWLKLNPDIDRSQPKNRDQTMEQKSIAVLAFRSLSSDQEDQLFAEGLAEEIIHSLSRISDLLVASRSASFQYAQSEERDPKKIAADLEVNYLLMGSIRKSGDKLRVSVELIEAENKFTVWSKTYNNTLTDIFDVQDQISERVANALKSTLWESAIGQRARSRTANVEAYRDYLIALHYDREMHQGGEEALNKVREFAELAVKKDDQFLPAWIMLADVYLNRMGYRMPREEAHAHARNALNHALELEPSNPEVLLKLAELARGDHEYGRALTLYRRARDAEPNTPSVDYATLLYTVGHLEPALKEFQDCIKLDPENFSIRYYYACALLSNGETEASLNNYEKSLQVAGTGFLSDGVRATLAGITFLYGDKAAVNDIFAPCLNHNPDRIDFEKGLIAGIQGLMGDKQTAGRIAEELESRALQEHIDPQALFWVYYGLDIPDGDRLYHWMNRMVEEDSFPSMYFLKTWPPLSALRPDARFQSLLKKAGVEDVSLEPESNVTPLFSNA